MLPKLSWLLNVSWKVTPTAAAVMTLTAAAVTLTAVAVRAAALVALIAVAVIAAVGAAATVAAAVAVTVAVTVTARKAQRRRKEAVSVMTGRIGIGVPREVEAPLTSAAKREMRDGREKGGAALVVEVEAEVVAVIVTAIGRGADATKCFNKIFLSRGSEVVR